MGRQVKNVKWGQMKRYAKNCEYLLLFIFILLLKLFSLYLVPAPASVGLLDQNARTSPNKGTENGIKSKKQKNSHIYKIFPKNTPKRIFLWYPYENKMVYRQYMSETGVGWNDTVNTGDVLEDTISTRSLR